jgi:hypothetical protein
MKEEVQKLNGKKEKKRLKAAEAEKDTQEETVAGSSEDLANQALGKKLEDNEIIDKL